MQLMRNFVIASDPMRQQPMLALTALIVPAHCFTPGAFHLQVTTPRTSTPCMLDPPPAGVVVTILSGLAIILRRDSAFWGLFEDDEQLSADAQALVDVLCRKDGWDLRASIGAEEARALGGTGRLALSGASGTAEVSMPLAFDRDQRFAAFAQGRTRLLRPTSFLSSEADGLWSLDPVAEDDDLRQAIEVCLPCEGLELSGTELVPAGKLYLTAQLELDERASRVAALTSGAVDGNAVLRFNDGRVVIKEASAMQQAAGLSELKVVGSLEAKPAARAPPPPPPASLRMPPPPASPPPDSPPPAAPPSLLSSPLLPRRALLAAASVAASVGVYGGAAPLPATAADLSALASRPLGGESLDVSSFQILAAQASAKKLLADEETYKTMAMMGLPTSSLGMPPNLPFALFKRYEPLVKDPDAFMDAAIEYVEYARDGNDLLALASMARTNGGGPSAVKDYVERALESARGAAKALDRLVPLLPP